MSEYTSNLLCHFVGRSKENDNERFDLLKNIIEGKTLIANLSEPENPQSYFQRGDNCKNVGEVFSKCDCVCFCDIPDHALSIHINKYSYFGLGFNKEFIAAQGARPVMYVPKNYPIIERTDGKHNAQSASPRNPNEYFPYILSIVCNLPVLMEMCCDPELLKKKFYDSGLTQHLNLFDNQVTGDTPEVIYNNFVLQIDKHIFLNIKAEAFDALEVTLSPKISEGNRKIVELLREKFCPNMKILESTLKDCLR